MKKAGIILLVVGIVLILFSLVFPIAALIMHIDEIQDAAIGIIGGADGPTAWFLFSNLIQRTYLRFVMDAGVIAVIVSGILFVKAKRKK